MNDTQPVLIDLHSASSRRESQNAFRRRKKGTVATRPHSSALGRTSGPVVRSDLAGAMVLVQRAAARATCRAGVVQYDIRMPHGVSRNQRWRPVRWLGRPQSQGTIHRKPVCKSGHLSRSGPWPGTAPVSPLAQPNGGAVLREEGCSGG